MPILGDQQHKEMVEHWKTLSSTLKDRPKAILLISGHHEVLTPLLTCSSCLSKSLRKLLYQILSKCLSSTRPIVGAPQNQDVSAFQGAIKCAFTFFVRCLAIRKDIVSTDQIVLVSDFQNKRYRKPFLSSYCECVDLQAPAKSAVFCYVNALTSFFWIGYMQERIPTVTSSPHPPMIYDYRGFPPEVYICSSAIRLRSMSIYSGD